jgi:hypothetical protein
MPPNEPGPLDFPSHGSEAVRLPSLPKRLEILERISTEAIQDPHISKYRQRAQYTFFGGADPAELGGYEGQLEVVGRCLEWFVYDYYIPDLDATPAVFWLRQNADKLSNEEQANVRDCLNFVLSIYEVADVHPQKGFTAIDLLREPLRYHVSERLITAEIETGQLLLGRLFPHHSSFVLSGMAALMDSHATRQIKEFIISGKLNPAAVVENIDGVELENLFGRSIHESVNISDVDVLYERLHRYLEILQPGAFSLTELQQLVQKSTHAVSLTADLCDNLQIFCRHEIDLLFAYIDAILNKSK